MAFSSVVRERVACNVPDTNVPEGARFERKGDVVSGSGGTAAVLNVCVVAVMRFPDESFDLIR